MELRVEFVPGGGLPASTVGRLWQDRSGVVWFEYETAWRDGKYELSPVFLGNRTSHGGLANPSRSFGELFGLFQDCLPDWWGERLMIRFFDALGVPWRRVGILQKLACQGDRKPGALVFAPALEDVDFKTGMAADVDELARAAAELVSGRTDNLLDRLVQAGLSPGGAQPKVAVAFDAGFTQSVAADIPPEGFTAWLVKFDLTPELQAARIEHAYALMAGAAGIAVPETRLLDGRAGACHFLSRRFDRGPGGARRHVHTFSGLTHTPVRDAIDYADLIELTRALVGHESAVEEIFRRAVFNVASGNDDDHGRNHAFLMDESGKWGIAPAYDLNPASNPLTSGIRAAALDGKFHGIHREDLIRFGARHGVQRAERIVGEVLAAIAAWPDHAVAAGLNASRIKDLGASLARPFG